MRAGVNQVIEVARSFTVAGLRQPRCAEAAWRAVLDGDTALINQIAGLRGLQSLLLAETRYAEAERLLANVGRVRPKYLAQVYITDLIANAPYDVQAAVGADTIRDGIRTNPELPSERIWSLGLWEARQRRADAVRWVAELLEARHRKLGKPMDSVFARSLRSRLALLAGDTATALGILEGLTSVGSKVAITWEEYGALPTERLLLAELQLARRQWRAALETASGFDAPAPLIYAAFLPASLRIRILAARALEEYDLARRLDARYRALRRGPPRR
jgi:hypothetical protein